MELLLEIENLVTRFYTVDGVVNAVNGISYTLNRGECLAIVGESGCGKSVGVLSLIRLIQSPPGKVDAGKVMFNGIDLLKISDEEMRKVRGSKIGMIFQDPMTSLNPVMKVGEQISESLVFHEGMTQNQANKRTIELLDLVGIPNAADRSGDYPHQFSGGMRQRVMIAIGLACHPDLLIADEPTTALDVTIQAQILDLIRRLQAEFKMAVIWISHDLGVVAGLADRVLVMYGGYIVEKSKVDELYSHPRHPYTSGLLNSLPRLDSNEKRRLKSIEGFPPNLVGEMQGCPFAPRCSQADERCRGENPVLLPAGEDHQAACWKPL
jgi:oligopeptide transport system ATP-binding protein